MAITQLGLHGPQLAYQTFEAKAAAEVDTSDGTTPGEKVPKGSLFIRDRTYQPFTPRSVPRGGRWFKT